MLGKNNFKERLRKMEEQDKQERFSIRKLSIGAASVLIGFAFMGWGGQNVLADQVMPNSKPETVKVDHADQDTQTEKQQSASTLTKSTDSLTKDEVKIDTNKTKEGASNEEASSSISDQKDVQNKDQNSQPAGDAGKESNVVGKSVQGEDTKQATTEKNVTDTQVTDTVKAGSVAAQDNKDETNTGLSTDVAFAKGQAIKTTDLKIKNLKTKDLNNGMSAADLAKLFGMSLARDINHYSADDWDYTNNSDGSGITLTGYKGAATTDYYIPNAATFRDAGKINDNQGVSITYELMHNLYNGKDYNLADNPGIGYKLEATSIHVQRAAKKADMVKAVGGFVKNGLHNCWDWVFSPDLPESVDRNSEDTYKDGQNSNWALESVDLAGLDTSTVDRMAGMFAANASLETISGLDTWDTSKVATTGHMFAWDISLDKIQGLEN